MSVWQSYVPIDCRQASEDGDCDSNEAGCLSGQSNLLKEHEDAGPGEGTSRVERRGSKETGDFVANHLGDHAAECPGDHSKQRGHEPGGAGFEGQSRAEDGEEPQAESVRQMQETRDPAGEPRKEGGQESEKEEDEWVLGIANPEEWIAVEEEIAQGAASKSDHAGQSKEPDEIHAVPLSEQNTVEPGRDDGEQFDDLEEVIHGGGEELAGQLGHKRVLVNPVEATRTAGSLLRGGADHLQM